MMFGKTGYASYQVATLEDPIRMVPATFPAMNIQVASNHGKHVGQAGFTSLPGKRIDIIT